MTPAATTPAARTRRRSTTPRPRRVSGPVGGAVPAPVAAPPAPARAPVAPRRRVSAPARPARPARPVRPARRGASARRRPPLGARIGTFVRGLPDHSLLDRLIRGRVWIALLGLMLVGIVATQVEVLKLGASMGRNIERATALQGRNEALRASVAALADDQRIEALAAKQGMLMPAPSDVTFVAPGGAPAITRAVSAIHAPAASSFLSATTGTGAVVTVASQSSSGSSSAGTSTDTGASASSATGATSGASSTIPVAGSTSSSTP